MRPNAWHGGRMTEYGEGILSERGAPPPARTDEPAGAEKPKPEIVCVAGSPGELTYDRGPPPVPRRHSSFVIHRHSVQCAPGW